MGGGEGGLVWVWMLGFGWVGGLQGGVEGVGHCVFGWEVCVGFVRGGECVAVRGCCAELWCRGEGGTREDGVALELLFQVWSRPGWQERPTKQLSHLEIVLPLVSDSF